MEGNGIVGTGRKNPCDLCNHRNNCEGCILNQTWTKKEECENQNCVCHYEFGCLLSLDATCKASTCYKEEKLCV